MSKVGVFIFITLLVTIINAAEDFPADCDARLQAMDDAMKVGLVLTNPKPVNFRTPRDLVRYYCVPMKTHLKTIEAYKPCLQPFPRRLFMNVLANAKKNARYICSTPKSRREFVQYMKCFTPDNYPRFLQIGNNVTSLIMHLTDNVDTDAIIPHMCCGFHIVLRRAKQTADELCSKSGVEDGSEYFTKIVKKSISEAFEMICPGIISFDHCKNKYPEVVVNVRRIMRRYKDVQWEYSPATAFLKVIDRLVGDE